MPVRFEISSQYGKRIPIRLAEYYAHAFQKIAQAFLHPPQGGTLAVTVQDAHDRHPQPRTAEGVVVLQLAGQIEASAAGGVCISSPTGARCE